MKTIDDFNEWGITVRAVVITRYEEQPGAQSFFNKLERRGVKVYTPGLQKAIQRTLILLLAKRLWRQ
jgi:uncharacterized protein (UPF0371 family)